MLEEQQQLFKDIVGGIEEASAVLDLYALSEALVALGSLGAAISEPLLAAQADKVSTSISPSSLNKDLYRAYQRLDHDIMLEVRVVQSRLAVLKLEKQNSERSV